MFSTFSQGPSLPSSSATTHTRALQQRKALLVQKTASRAEPALPLGTDLHTAYGWHRQVCIMIQILPWGA